MATKPQGEQSPREHSHDVGMTPNQHPEERASLDGQPLHPVFMANPKIVQTAAASNVHPTVPHPERMTSPKSADPKELPGAMPAQDARTGGMKKRPLEAIDLGLQVVALLLILVSLRGVDVPLLTVDLPLALVALVVKLVVIATDRER